MLPNALMVYQPTLNSPMHPLSNIGHLVQSSWQERDALTSGQRHNNSRRALDLLWMQCTSCQRYLSKFSAASPDWVILNIKSFCCQLHSYTVQWDGNNTVSLLLFSSPDGSTPASPSLETDEHACVRHVSFSLPRYPWTDWLFCFFVFAFVFVWGLLNGLFV